MAGCLLELAKETTGTLIQELYAVRRELERMGNTVDELAEDHLAAGSHSVILHVFSDGDGLFANGVIVRILGTESVALGDSRRANLFFEEHSKETIEGSRAGALLEMK